MARQLREQLDEEVTVIGKDDFGPAVKRPPAPAPEQPGKADETPPPS